MLLLLSLVAPAVVCASLSVTSTWNAPARPSHNATTVKYHRQRQIGANVNTNYDIVYVELQDFVAPQHENGYLHSYLNGQVEQWDYYAFRVDAGEVIRITGSDLTHVLYAVPANRHL